MRLRQWGFLFMAEKACRAAASTRLHSDSCDKAKSRLCLSPAAEGNCATAGDSVFMDQSTFSFRLDLHEVAGPFESRQVYISDTFDLHIIQRQSALEMNRSSPVFKIGLA